MVPRDTTLAVVACELPGLQAYAQRHGWSVDWRPEPLVLILDGRHPADGSPVRLHADVTGYRAVPPGWRFISHDGEPPSATRAPKPGTLPGNIGSIFHANGIICAPFNRLAYAEHSGPHGDWGGPAKWLGVRGHVTAKELGQMLAQIVLHLKYSPGWQI